VTENRRNTDLIPVNTKFFEHGNHQAEREKQKLAIKAGACAIPGKESHTKVSYRDSHHH
jgi:hypothetical protein